MLARTLPASVINADRAARRQRQDNAEAFDVAARPSRRAGWSRRCPARGPLPPPSSPPATPKRRSTPGPS
jgi:hypothetical protein